MDKQARANKRARKAKDAALRASVAGPLVSRERFTGRSVTPSSNSELTVSGQPGNAGDANGMSYQDLSRRTNEAWTPYGMSPRQYARNTNAKSAIWRNGTPLRYWEPAISAYDGKN